MFISLLAPRFLCFLPFLDRDYKFIDATLELAKVGVEFGLERKI